MINSYVIVKWSLKHTVIHDICCAALKWLYNWEDNLASITSTTGAFGSWICSVVNSALYHIS